MNWIKQNAECIETVKPGTMISIDNVKYIKMMDDITRHIEGFLFNPENGWHGHWSRLVKYNEQVEVFL